MCREHIYIYFYMQGFRVIRVFGLCGFGFTRLRKIINIKKIVRFTTRTQIYAVFGRV